ncbi:MAG: GntR family transcriptional regulator [Burkholderiales bacterium]
MTRLQDASPLRIRAAAVRSDRLYLRVKTALTEGLSEGRWAFGESIPSENALSRQFGVSIGTVRHAIDELVTEGILVRQHGRGTFVASHTRDYLYNVFFRIVDPDGGRQRASPRLISFRRGYADATTATQLRIARGAAIYRIVNAIMLDGRAVACDDIRLPQRLFPALTRDEVAQRDRTVYGVLQQHYGVDALWAKELITAVRAGAWAGSILGLRANSPVLRLQRTAYSYKELPIDFRYRYISTKRHSYLSLLGRASGID